MVSQSLVWTAAVQRPRQHNWGRRRKTAVKSAPARTGRGPDRFRRSERAQAPAAVIRMGRDRPGGLGSPRATRRVPEAAPLPEGRHVGAGHSGKEDDT